MTLEELEKYITNIQKQVNELVIKVQRLKEQKKYEEQKHCMNMVRLLKRAEKNLKENKNMENLVVVGNFLCLKEDKKALKYTIRAYNKLVDKKYRFKAKQPNSLFSKLKANFEKIAPAHNAEYLTYKHYLLNEKLLNQDQEKVKAKFLKKYEQKIQKIDEQYDKYLNGRNPQQVLSLISNVSASYAKENSKITTNLLDFNTEGYLTGESYLKYVDQLASSGAISKNELQIKQEKLNTLYCNAKTLKKCVERVQDNLDLLKTNYKKRLKRFTVGATSLVMGLSLAITGCGLKKSENLGTQKETEKNAVLATASDIHKNEEAQEENLNSKVELSLDEYLSQSLAKEEYLSIKNSLLQIQEKINQKNKDIEEVEDTINVGDFVEISKDARIYSDIYSLGNDQNSLSSYYKDKEVRVIKSIVYKNENGIITEESSMEDYEELLANGYDVIGYTVLNQYSGDNLVVEGRFKAQDVSTLTRK